MALQEDKFIGFTDGLEHCLARYHKVLAALTTAEVSRTFALITLALLKSLFRLSYWRTILKHYSEFLNLAARDLIGTHLAYKITLQSVNRYTHANLTHNVPALGYEGGAMSSSDG